MSDVCTFQWLTFSVQCLAFLAVSISTGIAAWKIRTITNWNRRKATHELTFAIVQGDFLEIRKKLDSYANWYELEEDYSTVITDKNREEINSSLKYYLSFFEGVALGIKNDVYDNDIVYDYFGSSLPEIIRWANPYINKLRTNDKSIFIEIMNLTEKWKNKT